MRTHFVKPNWPTVIAKGAHPHLSLRGAQSLMVSLSNHVAISLRLSHTSGNHHCYGDEIATPVSSTGSQ